MGFLNRLLGSSEQVTSTNKPGLKAWTYNTQNMVIVKINKFDSIRHVYVYDGKPLTYLKERQQITLTPYLGEGTLKSSSTGKLGSTKENNDTILMYNNVPVGFVNIPRSAIKELAQNNIKVEFIAECRGELSGYKGIKDIVIFAPHRFYASEIISIAQAKKYGAGETIEILDYNEYDQEDFAELLEKDYWEFPHAKVEFIPMKKGSKAKPHILLTSEKGRKISKVTGRNGYYKELSELVSDEIDCFVTARNVLIDDKKAYHIHICYWKKE